MIVEFFRGSRSDGSHHYVQVYYAMVNDTVRALLEKSIDVRRSEGLFPIGDIEKITEIDFEDADTDSVETLVDALLLSGILGRNINFTRDSALYVLVNESLTNLDWSESD